jgi:hypothetical protein
MTDSKNLHNDTEKEVELSAEEIEFNQPTNNDDVPSDSVENVDDVVFDEDSELNNNQVVKKTSKKTTKKSTKSSKRSR